VERCCTAGQTTDDNVIWRITYWITKAIMILIRRTSCVRAQFSGCSSTINAHSEKGQMAVCCQILPLGALSSRRTPSLMVGALFKKFGLFLNRGVHLRPYSQMPG
jgi:hypothetical protein